MTSWEEFRRSVTIPGQSRLRPATDASLDAFEKHAGIPLPRSYREFVKVFGACALGRRGVMIAAPRRKRDKHSRFDLISKADQMHGICKASTMPAPDLPQPPDPAQTLRMVFFASDGMNKSFGWDPAEVSVASNHEYAVYSRYSDYEPYTRLASSFEEFVLSFCLGEEVKRWREAGRPVGKKGFDYEPDEDPRLYIAPY